MLYELGIIVLILVVVLVLGLIYLATKKPTWNSSGREILYQILTPFNDKIGQFGSVTIICPDNKKVFGDPNNAQGDHITLHVTNPAFFDHVIALGHLGFAESYMDDWFHYDVDEYGTIYRFMKLMLRLQIEKVLKPTFRLALRVVVLWVQVSVLKSARKNIEIHYGVSERLYRRMLDPLMLYTCGKVMGEDAKLPMDSPKLWHMDLYKLQVDKLNRIYEKIDIQKGQRVLDFGCGFGGASIFAAKEFGCKVTSFCNSSMMIKVAREQAIKFNVADKVTFHDADWRDIMPKIPSKSIDRFVCIGVFEHVHRHQYKFVFDQIERVLADDGVGIIHANGKIHALDKYDPFIQKYIFPDSVTILLSPILRELENRGIFVLDIENVGSHYYPTLMQWSKNSREFFKENPTEFPPKFQRMWLHYLEACGAISSYGSWRLWQIVFTKNPFIHKLTRV